VFNSIATLDGSESWDELRGKFGKALGLAEPVPSATLRRALLDQEFAHSLLVSRNSPHFLKRLMEDPDNIRYDDFGAQELVAPRAVSSATGSAGARSSNLELAGKAAGALLRWGKSGFTQVSAEVFARRQSACESCPHLVEAPDQLAYKISFTRKEDMRTCELCGCVAARKARLPHERCPGSHPTEPGKDRWGESKSN
jgi:hypothetical protein